MNRPTFEEWLAEVMDRCPTKRELTEWERSKLRAQGYERGHSPLFGAALLSRLRTNERAP